MSTFRRRMAVTLDGERFEITTMAGDHLKAEEAIGREKKQIDQSPVMLQLRVAFHGFSRTYPEHPLARNWAKFIEVFDDFDDLEEEEGSPLDPTQTADWES
jgi:hypothetical protein